jgi:hypothetical protein
MNWTGAHDSRFLAGVERCHVARGHAYARRDERASSLGHLRSLLRTSAESPAHVPSRMVQRS